MRLVPRIQRRNWKTQYSEGWNDSYKADVEKLGGMCKNCGCKNTFANPLQRHHVVPLAKGGSNSYLNLKLLCRRCHMKQHRR